MKPKLLLLSGPPGIGKSTIAQKYVDEHPMALKLDIDLVWWMMGQWQASRPHSHKQKMKLAYALAHTHLYEGYDVIVAQDLESLDYYKEFEAIANTCKADLREVTLLAPLDEAIERCKARGRALGYKTGFRPGGILESEGKEKKLEQMYNTVLEVIEARPNMVVIQSELGQTDKTYQLLLAAL